MSEKIVQLNEEVIKGQLKELVRGSNVFGAPAIVRAIVEKLTPAHEEGKKVNPQKLNGMDTVTVDENGEIEIPSEIVVGKTQGLFGPKVYETILQDAQEKVEAISHSKDISSVGKQVQGLASTIKDSLNQNILAPAAEEYGIKKGTQSRLERQVEREIDHAFEKIQGDYDQQVRIAQAELERKQKAVVSAQEVQQAEAEFQADMDGAMKAFLDTV